MNEKVFISYAKKDQKIALKIYSDLLNNGMSPWIDQVNLLPGQNWKIEIAKAIKESRYFIALFSSNSVNKKGYIQKELKIALDTLDEFNESDVFIIPVRIDDCFPDNQKLKDIHFSDLFPSYGQGFQKILKAILPDGPINKNKLDNVAISKPDENFYCYKLGNIEIPACPVIGSPETPFNFEEVEIKYRPRIFEESPNYPKELLGLKSYLIGKCKKRYKFEIFEDNIIVRLDDINQYPEKEDDSRGGLLIELSLTTYSSLFATNMALDEKIIPSTDTGFITTKTIRQKFAKLPYTDLSKSILSNAPGVEVVLISKNKMQNPKNQMIIRKRSNKIHFYRNHYQVSASGYMGLGHKDGNGNPNPFITGITEARQEVADSLILSPKDFKLIGVAIHWHGIYPAFYGYIETEIPAKELLGDFKRDSYEGELYAISFDPKTVLNHIATEKWTAISALAVISTLFAFFPRSSIESVAKQVPCKNAMDFLKYADT